jgi:hypothetical protein
VQLDDAYSFLGLKPTSTEAERYEAYESTRSKLESKLAKAPTQGLKEKYRDLLRTMEAAIEVIEDSVDGGDLPTLAPTPSVVDAAPASVEPPPETAAPRAPSRPVERKRHGTEIKVIGIAVAVFAAAGFWFIQGQNQQVAVVAELAQVRQQLDELKSDRANMLERRARHALSGGESLSMISDDDIAQMIEAPLSDAERLSKLEEWRTAYKRMQEAKSGIRSLSQLVYDGEQELESELTGKVRDAVANFRANLEEPFMNLNALLMALDSPGIDVNQVRSDGLTLYDLAAKGVAGHVISNGIYLSEGLQVARKLLGNFDVDVNKVIEDNGNTALIAVLEDYGDGSFRDTAPEKREFIELILNEPGLDINLTGEYGNTALHQAAAGNAGEVLQQILDHPDVNVNATDNDRWTPLMEAAHRGNVDAVRRILAHPSVSLFETTYKGSTALDMAREDESAKNSSSGLGFNPFSSWRSNPEIIRLLEQAMGR